MVSAVKTCVLYARLSVSKEESVSIARQLNTARKFAEARGWEVVGEFVDDGVSATLNRPENRPGWKALMSTPGGFDAVIIWKVDRLARKVLDFLNVDAALQARGAGLVAVEDPIDMTTPMGRAFATILAVFGEMEAEAIRSRIKAARKQIIHDGRWPGGGVPYGYMSVPNPNGAGRVLARDPERIEWLRKAARRVLDGATINSVATWLTDQGAPLAADSAKRRKTPSTAWHRQTVASMLTTPVLAGMTPYNPGRKKSAVGRGDVLRDDDGNPVIKPELAIMTVTEWEALQQTLATSDHPASVKGDARRRTSALLSKVARCDDCDVYMCRGTNGGRAVLYCPACRQTIGRERLDAHLVNGLMCRVGGFPHGHVTIRRWWPVGGEAEQREVLITYLTSLRIRRGKQGAYFDPDRVLATWTVPDSQELAAAA